MIVLMSLALPSSRTRSAAALLLGLIAASSAQAEIVGWLDVVDRGGASGWALDTQSNAALDVAIWVAPIDVNGHVGAYDQSLSRTVKANGVRADLAGYGQGVNHGFNSPLQFLPEGAWFIHPVAYNPAAPAVVALLSPGNVRVVRRITPTPRTDLWFRWRGVVQGLNRANDYESYPTVMYENGQYKMWFCGGPGDKIYYATSANPYSGWTVAQSWWPVMGESSTGLDNGLICDPSVVKPPGQPYYFMTYTAVAKAGAGYTLNRVFSALSTDGLTWHKMDGRNQSLVTNPWPILWSTTETASAWAASNDYGTGQSSMLFGSLGFLGKSGGGFINYYTDTTVGGIGVASSSNGGWSYDKVAVPLPKMPGQYTWDFKRHVGTGRTFGMVALFGEHPAGNPVIRQGAIEATVSADGLHFTDSAAVHVPMVQLTDDDQHQCLNNGGLIGNAVGDIEGDETVFYMGAGWGTNADPSFLGVWPPNRWDIAAMDVKLHDCGPGIPGDPCGTPAPPPPPPPPPPKDAGHPGPPDAGPVGGADAGEPDAGTTTVNDAGEPADGGAEVNSDAGEGAPSTDGGAPLVDGGVPGTGTAMGCSCAESGASLHGLWLFAAAALRSLGRRRRGRWYSPQR